MMADGQLGTFVREFMECVVNSHDLNTIDRAVNEMVSPEWHGDMAPDVEGLRAFYHRQAIQRPDWHIDAQETLEVGEYVATRALAGGKLAFDQDGLPWQPGYPIAVEWLTVTRIVDGKAVEGRLVTWLVTARA